MEKIELSTTRFYELCPINVVLISTVSKLGVPDVAPFGLVCPISHDPPIICVGISKKRKTYSNILHSKELVVNLPTQDMVEIVNKTALAVSPEFNKFKEYGLTAIPSLKVAAPTVKECIFHFECTLDRIVDVEGDHDIVVGRVIAARANRDLAELKSERVIRALRPVLYISEVDTFYGLGTFLGRSIYK